MTASLPDCPTCGGTQIANPFKCPCRDEPGHSHPCPDCTDGKVTVAQMAALWGAVHARGKESALIPVVGVNNFATKEHHGASVMLDHLRAVRP